MSDFARLTWQAEDPGAFAASLGTRLGVRPRPGGLGAGAWLLRRGSAALEVRPWIREGPTDDPRPSGRLMLEPVPDGEPTLEPVASDPVVLVGLGWATVELDRAQSELGPWLGPRAAGNPWVDAQLGATAVLQRGAGLPGLWTVLLEPSTEGGTAASLARDGEGPCALYLRPAGGLEPWLDAVREALDGPFGRQVLLPGPFTGPFVIITEGTEPAVEAAPPGPIGP